jgi:glycosyltransferase involved in cell wall biosynthesis
MICVHLAGNVLPYTSGGSEVFIARLCRELKVFGWKNFVAIHETRVLRDRIRRSSDSNPYKDDYEIIMLPELKGGREVYYTKRPQSSAGFRELLHRLRPNIVHFHTFGAGASLVHMEEARRTGARLVITYHTGGVSCPQTGLLRNGRIPCDGRLNVHRCTMCRYRSRGMAAVPAWIVAYAPPIAASAESPKLLSRLVTSREMTKRFVKSFVAMSEIIDVIHIQAHWIKSVLTVNGVPESKIKFVEMGAPFASKPVRDQPERDCFNAERPLRLAYVGRCSDVKGIDVLINAVKRLPGCHVQVSLFGQGWETDYGGYLMSQMQGDPRFLKPRSLSPNAVVQALAEHDLCVVPSVWLETGPLVIYESFGAGVPVLGSRLGGIAERITDGVDGRLFTPGNANELGVIIQQLANSHLEVNRLRRGVRPQRSFAEVASDMDALYRNVDRGLR